MNKVQTIIQLALIVLMYAGMWKIFVKAGEPGWACLIPIYNIIVLLKIVHRPIWWIVLFLIFVGFILVAMDLAECFGKSKGWGIGLLFILPFIGYPILGFGDAQYTAPARQA